MSTPHHRIHRLAATGGALLALTAALPAGAVAEVQPNPDQRVAPAARVLPHTSWLTPNAVGGAIAPQAYYYATDTTPSPRAQASDGTDVLVPAGFAGVVLLTGLTGAGVRRRRRAKVAA